jgi:hypothetical protein
MKKKMRQKHIHIIIMMMMMNSEEEFGINQSMMYYHRSNLDLVVHVKTVKVVIHNKKKQ